MAKSTRYRDAVLAGLAEDQKPAVIAVAEFLHRNESLHMHEDIEKKEPCAYCWLRAKYAYAATQQAGFVIVRREAHDDVEQLRQRIDELERDRAGRPVWSDGRDLAIKFRDEGATDAEIRDGFLGLWGGAQ